MTRLVEPAVVVLIALMVLAVVMVGVFEGYAQPGRESTGRGYTITVESQSPIEVVTALDLPAPPPLGWCADCELDQTVASLLVEHWDDFPPYFRFNDRYTLLALRDLVEACPGCAAVTPQEILNAVHGGPWLLRHYQRRLASCRGADRPCVGRRQVATGPEPHTYQCQYWVMSYEPVADAVVLTLRDMGLLDEGGMCPADQPLADDITAGRPQIPPFRLAEPDPSLFYKQN